MYINSVTTTFTDEELKQMFNSPADFESIYGDKLQCIIKKFNKSLNQTIVRKFDTDVISAIMEQIKKDG